MTQAAILVAALVLFGGSVLSMRDLVVNPDKHSLEYLWAGMRTVMLIFLAVIAAMAYGNV